MRFFLIDRITSWEPGRYGAAVKNVSLSEDFFDDHFPLKPIMPGVLMIEGMAQLSGLLLEEGVRKETGRNVKALMSIVERAKFRKPVYPGDTLEYRSEILSVNEMGGKVSAKAYVAKELVAESSFVFSFQMMDNPLLEECRKRLLTLWTRDLKQNG